MPRYNIFHQIHKGLRELLYHNASLLQQTDFSSQGETNQVLSALSEVMDLFDKHAATEDHWILPSIEQYEPSVTTVFAEEHITDHVLGEKLRSIIRGIQESSKQEDRDTWATVLRPVYIEFMVFNLQHMAKEEEVLNPLLWRYFNDEELKGITGRILGYLPPEVLQQYSVWMLRALSNLEIAAWLKEVNATAPAFIYQNLLSLAQEVVPGNRWNLIQSELQTTELAA